jgi:hypothetical protein
LVKPVEHIMLEFNSFWDGGRLTNVELVCISSFLRHGLTYNLYVYEDPENAPKNVALKAAEEILPRSRMFKYETGTFNVGSVSGFTNLFRYTLIHRFGGWWVDADICCLKAAFPESEEAYFQEPNKFGDFTVASSLFKAPASSPLLGYCLDKFAQKEVTQIVHGETGPALMTDAVLHFKKEAVPESALFFPIPWWEYERLFFDEELSFDNWSMVHFWNSLVASGGLDKNGSFPSKSVFERLKREYL